MPYKDKEKQKEAQKKHYLENKNKYHDSRKKNRKERDIWFRNFKSTLVCENCNFNNFLCLDFHHKDAKDKEFGISEAVKLGYSQDRIINEISKCEVLCANCHIKKHFVKKTFYHRNNVTKNLNWLNEYKSNFECVDCSEKDCVLLIFHHKKKKKKQIVFQTWFGLDIL